MTTADAIEGKQWNLDVVTGQLKLHNDKRQRLHARYQMEKETLNRDSRIRLRTTNRFQQPLQAHKMFIVPPIERIKHS